MSDLNLLFKKQDKSALWEAKKENASARYELAKIEERGACLISQREPVASLNIDREQLRAILRYVRYGVKILE